MEEEKQRLSLTKVIIVITGIVMLFHLEKVGEVMEPAMEWFQDSLYGLYNFPPGAQTAIAFLSILAVIVLVYRHIHK